MPKFSKLRAELEARIDEMIDLLDLIDGDPDLEQEFDACGFEDDRRRLPARKDDCEDFEPGTDAEPDDLDEDSLVPATGALCLRHVPREINGLSAADKEHRDTERVRRLGNGSVTIRAIYQGPFNPVRAQVRIVPRNYDPMRRAGR